MSEFFAELKRRNVVRVAIAYLVVGWIIMQIIDVVVEPLRLPDWTPTFVIVILVIGLPLALFFSWAYELTPQGVKKTREVDEDASITPSTGRKLDRMIIAALALAVAFLVYDRFASPPAAPPEAEEAAAAAVTAPAKSIAVLPFANLSASAETDSFVAGLHDDLLTQLSKVDDLKVISRTSVLRYAGATGSVKTIAQELGVATIMEGGVQRAGERVRINVQLIDSRNDEHLWAETYDRTLTTENIFDIQSEITRRIAGALAAVLTPAEEADLAARPTDNLEAYEAYLEAKLLQERTRNLGQNLFDEAIAAAERAVELDPDFLAAWSQLAFAHLSRFWFTSRDPADADAARDAIGRARELDPQATEVGLMQGLYHYWVNYEYEAALGELAPVLEAEPGNERAWAVRGWVLRRSGRWEEALHSMKKAAELSPNSIDSIVEVSLTLRVLDRFAETDRWITSAKKRFPGNNTIEQEHGRLILSTTGDPGRLIASLRSAVAAATPGSANALYHLLVEARYGDPQRGLDYLHRRAPGTIDVQYNFWPEDLLRAYLHHAAGNAVEARDFAARALPVIEAAQQLEPDEPDIEKAMAYAFALIGRAEDALSATARVREIYPRARDDWGGADFLLNASEALAIAGRYAIALEWLDDYFSGRGAQVTLLQIEKSRFFAALAERPGFAALAEKYGLVPADKSPPDATQR